MGFALKRKVRVEVVEFRDLQRASTSSGQTFGLTFQEVDERQVMGQALRVMVLKGMPGAWFGRVTVHEAMHAWMGENGVDPASAAHREGSCELLAYEWVRRRSTDFARNLAAAMLDSTDPVYGAGLREMIDYCERGGGPHDIPPSIMRKLRQLHSWSG